MWNGSKQAMQEHYDALAKNPPRPKVTKSRRAAAKGRKRKKRPFIERGELQDMHQEAMVYRGLEIAGAASLVASVGACLGNWPKVRRAKVAELRGRIEEARREYERLSAVGALTVGHREDV
jgi:hypothetical protein